jgi:glycosyltransferase involved in cell wall biosynthesis
MTSEISMPQANRLIGLFPALTGVGGVQEAGRLTAAALQGIASQHAWAWDLLALNDSPGVHELTCAGSDIAFSGFGRAKAKFVLDGMRQARRNARIILAAHPNLALPAAFMEGVARGISTIVMAHGVEVWKPLPPIVSRALQRAKIVLAPSRYTAGKLVELQGISQDKVRLLPWPLNPDFLSMASTHVTQALPPNFPTGPVVLTVGRWAANERYKGADDLLQAVSILRTSLPEIHLVAVGAGDDLPRLRGLAAHLEIEPHVRFFEGISREELAACYANAQVFALPSSGEGFGLVYLEAMAFAKPVVAASSGGATDVIADGKNGFLVPAHDVGALAKALGRLLSDDSLRHTMGQCGAAIVRDRYQFGAFCVALSRILGDCGLQTTVA